jgi:hypothetical protein
MTSWLSSIIPFDGVAGFASGGVSDELENLLEPLNLILRLALVFLEGSLQVFRLGSLRHLWKSGEYLLFGVIDVFQGLVKEVFKHLLFFGHRRVSSMCCSCDEATPRHVGEFRM